MEWNRARDFFREMESENQLILDAAGEGIYGINLEGKTTFVNMARRRCWAGPRRICLVRTSTP